MLTATSQSVVPDGRWIQVNERKTDDGGTVATYTDITDVKQAEQAIQESVLRAYKVLGCRGWARLDAMIDAKTRKPYLLEINTSPGMTGHSLVPMSARAAGVSYEDLCIEILRSARLDLKPTPGWQSA